VIFLVSGLSARFCRLHRQRITQVQQLYAILNWQRCPSEADNLIPHSDRGSQYLAIKYTERLAESGIDPSVGSVGDSYDNALAESTIGLFKTEVIHFLGPWKTVGRVEWETLKWVNWESYAGIWVMA